MSGSKLVSEYEIEGATAPAYAVWFSTSAIETWGAVRSMTNSGSSKTSATLPARSVQATESV